MFGDVDDGQREIVAVLAFLVIAGAVEEEDDVGVLFDGAGVAEVGEDSYVAPTGSLSVLVGMK